jgi:hypothetical protein
MEDTRLPKMVFSAKQKADVELEDLDWDGWMLFRLIKALIVKRWRIKAQDRKEWSAILRRLRLN